VRLIRSDSLDPFANLAAEEALTETPPPDATLFLWRSRAAVVIGRNQNPWVETSAAVLAREGALLARRVSGGGAVFHDEGNLNYAVVMPRDRYAADTVYAGVMAALSRFGIRADRMGKSSLGVGGRKISGNAFCFRRGVALHHGTLLIRSDLARLDRVLRGGLDIRNSRAVPSRRAVVSNLSEFRSGLSVAEVETVLADALSAEAGGPRPCALSECVDVRLLKSAEEKQESWAWRYGRTPHFDVTLRREAGGRDAAMDFSVDEGCVSGVRVESALWASGEEERWAGALRGRRFNANELATALETLNTRRGSPPAAAVAAWLRGFGF
jgi:lipoate-protein ligase A